MALEILFEFTIWFDEYEEEKETRLVVAKDENEAVAKIEKYSEELVEKGFAKIHYYPYPTIETFVII